jgi:hypothetical protein
VNDPTIELAVTVAVAGFALAFLRDAWCALRGGGGAPTSHFVDASRSLRLGARRAGASYI